MGTPRTHPTARVAELVGGFEQNTETLWLPIVLDSMWPPSPLSGFARASDLSLFSQIPFSFRMDYGLWIMDYGLWKRDVLTKGVAPQAAPHKRYAFPLRDVHSLAARQSGCALRSVPTVWALSAPREFSYIDARMESLCPCSHAPPSYLALDVSV